MKIIDLLLRYNFNRRLKLWSRYILKDRSVILQTSFRIIMSKAGDRQYIDIRKDSIIGARFIFESANGSVQIGERCYIGGSTFICRSAITIGHNVTIAGGCTIYDHDSHSLDYRDRRQDITDELHDIRSGRNFIHSKNWNVVNSKPIVIEDDAWIGMNCIILKGVTIGRGAVIGAGSVVTKDIPAWSVAAGNPAKVVKKLNITYNEK